uniref:Uncharacterized protein n=1 Tax=Rhizophora mucronata TaxID=61149 RepID=A0A2P2KLS8_RHIMU
MSEKKEKNQRKIKQSDKNPNKNKRIHIDTTKITDKLKQCCAEGRRERERETRREGGREY